jgi:hypothetical protein
MRKFTEVLELYLDERDRQNSNYYENRFIGSRMQGRWEMEELAKELDEMVQGVQNEQTVS